MTITHPAMGPATMNEAIRLVAARRFGYSWEAVTPIRWKVQIGHKPAVYGFTSAPAEDLCVMLAQLAGVPACAIFDPEVRADGYAIQERNMDGALVYVRTYHAD